MKSFSNTNSDPDFQKKLTTYHQTHTPEKIYLHTDKPFYAPRQHVWFSGYLMGDHNTPPDYLSSIVYVELFDPKDSALGKLKLAVTDGKFSGEFYLNPEAVGGLYKIKAYTKWMQDAQTTHFEKTLQVQTVIKPRLLLTLDFDREAYGSGAEVTAYLKARDSKNKPIALHKINYSLQLAGEPHSSYETTTDGKGEAQIKLTLPKKLSTNDGLLSLFFKYNGASESISRAIPIVLNNITIDFFPEGGHWIAGIPGKMAFKALDEFGKPADIEGVVVNENGETITQFQSFHQGMGAFKMQPRAGEKYEVSVTQPRGITIKYALPKATANEYGLGIEQMEPHQLKINVFNPFQNEAYLVVQSGHQVMHSRKIPAKQGLSSETISTQKFPIGISRISMFDAKHRVRSERLVFVNPHKQLRVTLQARQRNYQPRQKVEVDILTTNEQDTPVAANLSLAVVDDKILTLANDKQDNILSGLLMSAELKGKVHEPCFYFQPDQPKATPALDYVMLTHGWRQYQWNQVLSNPTSRHSKEQVSTTIRGQVMVREGQTKPIKAKVVLFELGGDHRKFETTTDQHGQFMFTDVPMDVPVQLFAQNRANKKKACKIVLRNHHRSECLSDFDAYYKYQILSEPRGSQRVGTRIVKSIGSRNFDASFFDRFSRFEERLSGKTNDTPTPLSLLEGFKPIEQDETYVPPIKNKAKTVYYRVNDQPSVDREQLVRLDLSKIKSLQLNPDFDSTMDVNITMAQKKSLKLKKTAPLLTGLLLNPMEYNAVVKTFVPKEYGIEEQSPKVRTDFRDTIYWNPSVQTNQAGEATLTFWNNDSLTTFRIIAEGWGQNGQLGRAESTYFTKLPLELTAKIPPYFLVNDLLALPVYLTNNTTEVIEGELHLSAPKAIRLEQRSISVLIPPHTTQTIYVKGEVLHVPRTKKEGQLFIKFSHPLYRESYRQPIKILGKGFPATQAYSGNQSSNLFRFKIPPYTDKSLRVKLVAYPDILGDLMDSVAAILERPYGCFEQASASTYPNILALQFLKTTKNTNATIQQKALEYIDEGYKKLTAFETRKKGFEWFGSPPPHEGLTAFGLLQFLDMKKVYPQVDDALIDRTKKMLLSRRDKKGGFHQEPGKYGFSGASEQVTNAYLVYALATAGVKDLEKEYQKAYDEACQSEDAYRLALVSLAATALDQPTAARKALDKLRDQVQHRQLGQLKVDHSIVRSYGASLQIETCALMALAEMQQPELDYNHLTPLIGYLVANRTGGYFGSTQGTILALQALTRHTTLQNSQSQNNDGHLLVYKNGHCIAQQHYSAQMQKLEIDGLEKHIQKGECHIEVAFDHPSKAIRFTIDIDYRTETPNPSMACKIALSTRLAANEVIVNQTVRLTTVVKNKKAIGQPFTIALVGIPSGLSAQPWQLKALQEEGKVDFYEIHDSYIAFYFRELAPQAVKTLPLDLKAEIPGTYKAQASMAYLYYTSEHKDWQEGTRITILPDEALP